MTAMEGRTLLLASLGGALEFYDFVIFVFFTAVIGKLFFPADLPDWLRQLQTYGIFAAGYLARPLGGVVMAHFGDMRGRKRMFTLSVLLMALPTLMIGLLPTYGSIGVWAPLLLLALRLMQGAAIGGEVPGGWVFVAEHAPPGRVGLAVGLLTGGLTGGILLGSLVANGIDGMFTQAQIVGGFWRLPFLIGGLSGLGAMVLRRWLAETPVFEEMRRNAAVSKELPLRAVLRGHGAAIGRSMASTWMLTAAIVVVILMTPTLLQKLFALTPRETLHANLAGTVSCCLSCVMVCAASDRFGVRRIAVPMVALLIASTYALYSGAFFWGALHLGAGRQPQFLLPLYVLAGAGVGAIGLVPVVMVRAFPDAVRFSGISFSYNVAYAIFGGTTPVMVSWLAHLDPLAPAHYVCAAALAGLVALWIKAPSASLGPHRGI